ncbi:ferric reductase-like transmembrane domain-containing protein [Alicyclobacillus macrosporangiidus]|uniref:ferric reductase-like transmembrane domain-containing protein n=1 Tax=Alicyclobacillus macrosporangiidus TaxID=392015 RepID=UPI0026E9F534|nr:ferric reductase-like transmembrane domain-containing protein [Alicyclobacillus macrosporangiidus]
MELLNERQRFPFGLVCAVTIIISLGSFAAMHAANPGRSTVNKFYWYMARSSGFTSYWLLSLAVLLGVSTTSALWDKWKLRKLMTQMHQYAALLVLPFLFFHLWGLYQDTSVPFGVPELLIAFTAKYRPVYTGFGVLTLYGWVLLVVTSYIREKMPVKMWRTIHYSSFPMFILVTLHGLLTGTDSHRVWAVAVYLIPSMLFIVLVMKRLWPRSGLKVGQK